MMPIPRRAPKTAPRMELALDDDGSDDVEAPGFGSVPKEALAF